MIKTQITIASQTVDCFLSDAQEYLYSLTSAADLLGKADNSALRWLNSDSFKALPGGDFQPYRYKEGNITYSLVPSWVIIKYLSHHAIRNGNELAMVLLEALAMESLDVRSMRAFDNLTPATYDSKVAETESYIQRWMDTRKFSKSIHTSFSTAAKHKKHPANLVHDKITELVNGMTAAEARQGQLVDAKLDPTIGLNYVGNINKLQIIALAKMEYAGLRAGGWEQQAERAVKIAMSEIKAALANR